MSLSAFLGTSLALAMALLAVAVTYLSERPIRVRSPLRSQGRDLNPHGSKATRL
jgi:hypothetical protein